MTAPLLPANTGELESSANSSASTVCNDAYTPIDTSGIALGWFLVGATLIAALPQLLALCRAKVSEGISVATPALALLYGTLNLCATLTEKWPSVQLCADLPPFDSHGCVDQLLEAGQQVSSAISLVLILMLIVAYPPHAGAADRATVAGAIVVAGAAITAACAVSSRWPCSDESAAFGSASAVGSAVLVIVAFAPQLVETYRSKGAGSLSAVYYFIQAAGCLLVIGLQAVALGDSVLVWGPTAVAAVLQGAICGLLVYYRSCKADSENKSGTMDDPLLVVQPADGPAGPHVVADDGSSPLPAAAAGRSSTCSRLTDTSL